MMNWAIEWRLSLGILHAHSLAMNEAATKANNLEKRIIPFAASILSLSSKLPKTTQARHISDQMLRSGAAAAANYAEARAAESRADFIHKLKLVSKELNETSVWLELTLQSELLAGEAISAALAENRELCRIISASIRTARASGKVLSQ
jgi:four helix bundle protein